MECMQELSHDALVIGTRNFVDRGLSISIAMILVTHCGKVAGNGAPCWLFWQTYIIHLRTETNLILVCIDGEQFFLCVGLDVLGILESIAIKISIPLLVWSFVHTFEL